MGIFEVKLIKSKGKFNGNEIRYGMIKALSACRTAISKVEIGEIARREIPYH